MWRTAAWDVIDTSVVFLHAEVFEHLTWFVVATRIQILASSRAITSNPPSRSSQSTAQHGFNPADYRIIKNRPCFRALRWIQTAAQRSEDCNSCKRALNQSACASWTQAFKTITLHCGKCTCQLQRSVVEPGRLPRVVHEPILGGLLYTLASKPKAPFA